MKNNFLDLLEKKKEEAGIKTISSIDIKIENGAKKENIPMGNNELYINNEKIN